MTKKSKKITKNTTLAEILKIKGSEKILAKHKIPCLFCPMAAFEISSLAIGQVAEMYGINLKKLLEDLNQII